MHEGERVGAALVGHAVGESLRVPAPSVPQVMGPVSPSGYGPSPAPVREVMGQRPEQGGRGGRGRRCYLQGAPPPLPSPY